MRVKCLLFVVAGLTLLLVGLAKADVVYDFEDVAVGTSTPFSDTKGGITASFYSTADPGGFGITTSFWAPPISGNVLYDPGPSFASGIPLDVSFSEALSSVSVDFATDGVGPFELSAYSGGTFVGTTSLVGTVPLGYYYPQGTIGFGGATFDSIVLESPNTPYFAVDNIDVTAASSTVPEPSRFIALLGLSAIGLVGCVLRRRRAKA